MSQTWGCRQKTSRFKDNVSPMGFQVDSKRENMGQSTKFKENIIKESVKSLKSKREDMNESKSPMGQRNVLKESL